MKHEMELRKARWGAALRLAFVISAIAAVAAITLSEAGEVSRGALIAAVMLVGFVASWVQTGRVARVHGAHRVVVAQSRR